MKELQDFVDRAQIKLSKSFNLTDAQNTKIINRYVKAVTNEINAKQSNYYRDNLNHFVSIVKIANNSKATINRERCYMHNWFVDNCPLFKIVALGNNLEKKFTEISMYYNITTITDALYTSTSNKEDVNLETVIDNLYGDELARYVYMADECLLDIVRIDLDSLKAYINMTETYINKNAKMNINTESLERRVQEAKRIYTLASVCNGSLLQVKHLSEFGRMFYRGPNLQSAHRDVRHAALGDCIEYDINNSVYAWRLSESKRITAEKGEEVKLPSTIDYMDRKEVIRSQLAAKVFKDMSMSSEYSKGLIKKAFTAIGFGARGTSSPAFWNDHNGNKQTYALNEIIKSPGARKTFLNDNYVSEFIKEQNQISKIIFSRYRNDYKHLEVVKTDKGNTSESKLLAYLYQHVETIILDNALSHIPKDDMLLRCHDAFYVSKMSPDDLLEVKWKIRNQCPSMSLSRTDIRRWHTVSAIYIQDNKEDLAEHERIIAQEMEKAKNYIPNHSMETKHILKTPEQLLKEQKEIRKKEIQNLETMLQKQSQGKDLMNKYLKSKGIKEIE